MRPKNRWYICITAGILLCLASGGKLSAGTPSGSIGVAPPPEISSPLGQIPSEILSEQMKGLSADVAKNIVIRVQSYSGSNREVRPDPSIYYYEKLPREMQRTQDALLLQKYGVGWGDLPKDAKDAYNALLALKGRQAENAVVARIADAGRAYFQSEKDAERYGVAPKNLQEFAKKLAVDEFLPFMTVDKEGEVVNKYRTPFGAFASFMASNIVGIAAQADPPGAGVKDWAFDKVLDKLLTKATDSGVQALESSKSNIKTVADLSKEWESLYGKAGSVASAENAVLIDEKGMGYQMSIRSAEGAFLKVASPALTKSQAMQADLERQVNNARESLRDILGAVKASDLLRAEAAEGKVPLSPTATYMLVKTLDRMEELGMEIPNFALLIRDPERLGPFLQQVAKATNQSELIREVDAWVAKPAELAAFVAGPRTSDIDEEIKLRLAGREAARVENQTPLELNEAYNNLNLILQHPVFNKPDNMSFKPSDVRTGRPAASPLSSPASAVPGATKAGAASSGPPSPLRSPAPSSAPGPRASSAPPTRSGLSSADLRWLQNMQSALNSNNLDRALVIMDRGIRGGAGTRIGQYLQADPKIVQSLNESGLKGTAAYFNARSQGMPMPNLRMK